MKFRQGFSNYYIDTALGENQNHGGLINLIGE